MLNKVIIFVLFTYKNYYCRFITLQLNHWWQMEYFGDVFHTFLDLDSVIYLAVNGIQNTHPKYHKFCSEDKQSFYGFGMTWGKWTITKL